MQCHPCILQLKLNDSTFLSNILVKAFHRASTATAITGFAATHDSVLLSMESDVFLPSFLYRDFENNFKVLSHANPNQLNCPFAVDHNDDDNAPAQLVCPITHELRQKILAADGATYERVASNLVSQPNCTAKNGTGTAYGQPQSTL